MATALGRNSKTYFVTQPVYETAVAPTGADAVKMKSKVVFTATQNAENRDDYHPSTRDIMDETTLEESYAVTCTAYLLGAGTQGNAPDYDAGLQTMFATEDIAATTVAASPAPTVSAIKLTANYMDAGDIGKIANTTGATTENKYFTVVSKDGSDVLTIYPPLDTAPTATDVIKAVRNYTLEADNTNVITIHQSNNLTGQMGIGVKFNKCTIKVSKGATGEIQFEGFARDVIRSVHTTLNGAVTATDLTVAVFKKGIEAGAILRITDAVNGDETVTVTSVDATGLILTLSAGLGFLHPDECVIGPYEPAATTAGTPIRGLCGGVSMGDDGDFIKADESTIMVDEKTEPETYMGDCGKSKGITNAQDREVSYECLCYLDDNSVSQAVTAAANSQLKTFQQSGATDGRGFAAYLPLVQYDPAEIPDSKGEIIKTTFKSRVCLGSSGEDSIKLAF